MCKWIIGIFVDWRLFRGSFFFSLFNSFDLLAFSFYSFFFFVFILKFVCSFKHSNPFKPQRYTLTHTQKQTQSHTRVVVCFPTKLIGYSHRFFFLPFVIWFSLHFGSKSQTKTLKRDGFLNWTTNAAQQMRCQNKLCQTD